MSLWSMWIRRSFSSVRITAWSVISNLASKFSTKLLVNFWPVSFFMLRNCTNSPKVNSIRGKQQNTRRPESINTMAKSSKRNRPILAKRDPLDTLDRIASIIIRMWKIVMIKNAFWSAREPVTQNASSKLYSEKSKKLWVKEKRNCLSCSRLSRSLVICSVLGS